MSSLDLATTGVVLGWLAFILHLAAFIVYGLGARKGQNAPNAATWTVWVFATILNCASYFVMSGDWVKTLQPLAGAIACLTIFILALRHRQFENLEVTEWAMLAIALVAVAVWYIWRDAAYANVILQGAFVVSFIPTLRKTWREPEGENSLPWFMWGGAYALLILTVAVRWQGQTSELVYPINSFFWHALAGVIALRRTVKG